MCVFLSQPRIWEVRKIENTEQEENRGYIYHIGDWLDKRLTSLYFPTLPVNKVTNLDSKDNNHFQELF